ncbi:hypothetical protein AB3K25_02515 [Leuconostoc sp. MS02]|uniref:Uncharacterized protein n=1 Tax=Leuconostoc aquikimchii TaxID=3236804 RepID=A0ABV3S566_9LACO
MIKLTKLEKHDIIRIANPKYIDLADIYVPDSHANSKQLMAEYVIETYDLGKLYGVKSTVSPHILDFNYLSGEQQSRVTGKIEYDA